MEEDDDIKTPNKNIFRINDFSKIVKFWKRISNQRPSFFKKIIPQYDSQKQVVCCLKYVDLSKKIIPTMDKEYFYNDESSN